MAGSLKKHKRYKESKSNLYKETRDFEQKLTSIRTERDGLEKRIAALNSYRGDSNQGWKIRIDSVNLSECE